MAKLKDILGINARSAEYLRFNKNKNRRRADEKLKTKKFLRKAKIPHPRLLGKISTLRSAFKFDWTKLKEGFVVKPVAGFGGNGILVVKRRAKYAGEWFLTSGEKVTVSDLRLHTSDIIEGRYSHNNLPDKVMIEERVKIHPKFRKLASGGTPDIRVLVFNKVPIMAMIRIPTAESRGKANLDQGAIGLGIDIATGITTFGVYGKTARIKYFPGTDRKVNGIQIPYWEKILKMAVETQIASGLEYLSVDMLIDQEKGPLVLELNDQPGLSIQLANMAGLRRRLERVEGLEVEDAEKGVKIAKALFASKFAKRVGFSVGEKQVVGIFEKIKVRVGKRKKIELQAKIDTGAKSTSIDKNLAKELGLLKRENILWKKKVKSSLGSHFRTYVQFIFWLKGKRIATYAGVTDRKDLRRRIIIGRRDLRDFLVDANLVKLR